MVLEYLDHGRDSCFFMCFLLLGCSFGLWVPRHPTVFQFVFFYILFFLFFIFFYSPLHWHLYYAKSFICLFYYFYIFIYSLLYPFFFSSTFQTTMYDIHRLYNVSMYNKVNLNFKWRRFVENLLVNSLKMALDQFSLI